jgi:hypothetical protein
MRILYLVGCKQTFPDAIQKECGRCKKIIYFKKETIEYAQSRRDLSLIAFRCKECFEKIGKGEKNFEPGFDFLIQPEPDSSSFN